MLLTGATQVGASNTKPSTCAYSFILGQKYLVYARGKEGALGAAKCTRTGLLKGESIDLKELDKINPGAYQPKAATAPKQTF